LLSLATTGCLISEPEGKPTYWPPQLGGTVEAVVGADLDANGSTDIVVFMSGTDSTAGAYYLSGATDLDWGSGDLVKTFSTFVPMDLVHPVAALVQDDAAPQIFVATGADTLSLSSFANNLRETGSGTTDVPGGGTAWLSPITFPGGQQHIAISNGSTVNHATTDLTDVKMLPPVGASTWNGAQTATSYADGADQVAVMATADTVYRCVIPMMPPFQWEPVRTGPPWLGQIAYDLDGDGHDEIIGFDPQAHDVCIVDVDAATIPVTPQCIHLADSTFTGTEVQIFAGINITDNPGLDILVAQATADGTAYSIVEDVTSSNGVYSYMRTRVPPVGGPGHGKSIIVTEATGMPLSLVTFGTNGAATCVLGPC
jgi:hypothetical protein